MVSGSSRWQSSIGISPSFFVLVHAQTVSHRPSSIFSPLMHCVLQDATTHAIVESIHTTLPIQLVRSTSDQILSKNHGIPSIGASGDVEDSNLAPEWRNGIGKRRRAGHLYSHVHDGWTCSPG